MANILPFANSVFGDKTPALFVYQKQVHGYRHTGIWALTSLDDYEQGKILTHEDVLRSKFERILQLREQNRKETSPILLTYPDDAVINKLIKKTVMAVASQTAYCGGNLELIWRIEDRKKIKEFKEAFDKLPRVYVADGHHRLAAAASMHNSSTQCISSLYVALSELRCLQFHRMFSPSAYINPVNLIADIAAFCHISHAEENRPYLPECRGKMGMYSNGIWYMLQFKSALSDSKPDVVLLQEKILAPLLQVTHPSEDLRLRNWPQYQLMEMLSSLSNQPDAIVFTLFPMSPEQLIAQAELGVPLPPKSTYTEPKASENLIVYQLDERAGDA